MKSKFFGMILGLALSMQGVMGMQNSDMEAWLEAEFDKCSQGAEVRVRQVKVTDSVDGVPSVSEKILVNIGNDCYVIGMNGEIHKEVKFDNNSGLLKEWYIGTRKEGSALLFKPVDGCPDIKVKCFQNGRTFISIFSKINLAANIGDGELVLNNTAYNEKLVVEAGRICTAGSVNVKDLVLKSHQDWFFNAGLVRTKHLHIFSHLGLNDGSYGAWSEMYGNPKFLNNDDDSDFSESASRSNSLFFKYASAGWKGFYSTSKSKCDVNDVIVKGVKEVQFGGKTHIGGTLDTNVRVILGYKDDTPDRDSLVYQCHINEIKNAPNIFVDTSSEITDAANGGIRWDKGEVKKITSKTEETVKKLKDVFVTDPPEAVSSIDDMSPSNVLYFEGKDDFKELLELYISCSLTEESLSSIDYDKTLDISLHNHDLIENLKLKARFIGDGLEITFYDSAGREYIGEAEKKLGTVWENTVRSHMIKMTQQGGSGSNNNSDENQSEVSDKNDDTEGDESEDNDDPIISDFEFEGNFDSEGVAQ